jgi:hypothetical protein
VALQLMRAGYHRVSVVRGGLPAMLEAGVAIAPKEPTPPLGPLSPVSKGIPTNP